MRKRRAAGFRAIAVALNGRAAAAMGEWSETHPQDKRRELRAMEGKTAKI
jgi:hypothetical protein